MQKNGLSTLNIGGHYGPSLGKGVGVGSIVSMAHAPWSSMAATVPTLKATCHYSILTCIGLHGKHQVDFVEGSPHGPHRKVARSYVAPSSPWGSVPPLTNLTPTDLLFPAPPHPPLVLGRRPQPMAAHSTANPISSMLQVVPRLPANAPFRRL